MKPFGVRLAAGAVTILLAVVMAGQAQKDRQNESDSSWSTMSTEIGELPKPIGLMPRESLDGPPSTEPIDDDNGTPFPLKDAAVQLVQHTEPIDNPTPESLKSDSPGFDLSKMSLPTFSEPDDAKAVPEANTAAMELPTMPNTFAKGTFAEDGEAQADLALPTTETPNTGDAGSIGLPSTPSIAVGGPSILSTPNNPAANDSSANNATVNDPASNAAGTFAADGPFADAGTVADIGDAAGQGTIAGQPGNVLRGGAGNALRPDQPQAEIAMPTHPGSTQPAGQTNTFAQGGEAMLRTMTLPGQPDAAAQQQNPNPAAAQPAQPASGIDALMNPALRMVGNPATNDVAAPAAGQLQGAAGQLQGAAAPLRGNGLSMGGVQPANTFNDQSYNQPTSNYGPGIPARAQPGQPVAPPLQNNGPAARVASLPNGAPGYQPRLFDQPNGAAQINVDPDDTLAAPGDRRFEGVQSPSIVIHKRAPSEVKVGKPASFVIHVQNTGSVEAMDVRVHDRVPAGMKLLDASPTPAQQGNVLIWQLGSMRAGDERTVSMQLVPLEEGELGSVARVTFEAAASVRTISTRPELKIVQTSRDKVLVGQQLEIDLEISNPGTGEATGVVLKEDVPDGLEHPKGRQLDNVIGTLRPGETRRQVLRLRAVKPGVIQNTIHLQGDDGLESTHTVAVEVVSPQLQMQLSGPSKRFLERKATYQLDIANTGTADATNVEIAAYLDRGFTFVSTEFEGQYDPGRHAVFWSLASLPAGGKGGVPLTLLPVQEGERAIRMEARADLGIVAKNERSVTVNSLAELTFQITDSADPVEVGGETMYEIKLTNSGSRNDSNVRVQLQLPQGVELLSSDADAETDGRGMIAFAPRRELAAGGDVVYRVKARGVAPGTHLIKAVVLSDQSTVPVTKEESTMVYSDR